MLIEFKWLSSAWCDGLQALAWYHLCIIIYRSEESTFILRAVCIVHGHHIAPEVDLHKPKKFMPIEFEVLHSEKCLSSAFPFLSHLP